jgi:hypothetical protein
MVLQDSFPGSRLASLCSRPGYGLSLPVVTTFLNFMELADHRGLRTLRVDQLRVFSEMCKYASPLLVVTLLYADVPSYNGA